MADMPQIFFGCDIPLDDNGKCWKVQKVCCNPLNFNRRERDI